MSAAGVSGVLLTGTIGVGKTTLAEAISERLHQEGVRHGLLDLDWLGQVYPPPDEADPFNDSLAVRNLAAIWPNFIAAGISHAVLAATVVHRNQLEAISGALQGCDLTVVRVVARPETVAARIRGRDHGRLLEDFLGRSDFVAGEIERAALESFSVSNEDRPPSELAEEILRQLEWL